MRTLNGNLDTVEPDEPQACAWGPHCRRNADLDWGLCPGADRRSPDAARPGTLRTARGCTACDPSEYEGADGRPAYRTGPTEVDPLHRLDTPRAFPVYSPPGGRTGTATEPHAR